MCGEFVIDCVSEEPVSLKYGEHRVRRACHRRHGIVIGGAWIEFNECSAGGGEKSVRVSHDEVAAEPDRDVHPIDQRIVTGHLDVFAHAGMIRGQTT